MSRAARALHKLGLGDAASRLLTPFARDDVPLPTPDEARACLAAIRPDRAPSCICPPREAAEDAGALVDVIVPVYNAARWLPACLSSVFGQKTDFPFRVVAVDDGSTDASGELLDACKDPRLTVLHQENRGLSGARNAALDVSGAPWIYFLDADDMLAEGALQALVDCARQTGARLVEGAHDIVDTGGALHSHVPHPAGALDVMRDCTGFACGKLFEAALFDRVRFPAGCWFEDSIMKQLLLPMLRAEGSKIWGIERSVFSYRVNPTGITQGGKRDPRSVDCVWLTLSLHRDRRALGLPDDQDYYEYLLNSLALSLRRLALLGEEAQRAAFVLYRELLRGEMAAFTTERGGWKVLEDAMRQGQFARARLFSSMH